MANSYRGETELTLERPVVLEGRSLSCVTIRFGINELAAMEEAFNLDSVAGLGKILQGASIRQMRTLLAAGLQRYQPGLTAEQVGDIMDDVGPSELLAILLRGLESAFPEAKSTPEGGGADPNRKRRRGTGGAS
jgi:hypothetical protein